MLVNIVVGLIVVAVILVRQMAPRAVKASPKGALIITVIGLVSAAQFVDHHHLSTLALATMVGSAALGVVFAVGRGFTVRIWRDENGVLMSRGTVTTLVLWVVGLAAHVGLDLIAGHGAGSATIVLYIGTMLLAQLLVVQWRAGALGSVQPKRPVSALHG
ncbi:hypothetical protein [uncultured Williamsia sp.]|uniref:hypothetical protein n=1 Tax=uncultured Williamsia sp. TaxID=259311 RepID=UPI0026030708|nr:hypothetical protein [uncultured Williamsia sp.]